MALRPLRHPQRVEHADEVRRGTGRSGPGGQIADRNDQFSGADRIEIDQRSAGIAVGVVVDTGPGSGALLDQNVASVGHHGLHTVGNESHPILLRCRLTQQSQAHEAWSLAPPSELAAQRSQDGTPRCQFPAAAVEFRAGIVSA